MIVIYYIGNYSHGICVFFSYLECARIKKLKERFISTHLYNYWEVTRKQKKHCSKHFVLSWYHHRFFVSFQYWRCVNGEGKQFSCLSGTVFNTKLNVCDWPNNVERPECRSWDTCAFRSWVARVYRALFYLFHLWWTSNIRLIDIQDQQLYNDLIKL